MKINGQPYDGKFIFSEIGYNFQGTELQAAFGQEQLKRLKKFSKIRKRNFRTLLNFFEKYKKFFVLPEQTLKSDTNWLAFPLTIKDTVPFSRLAMVKFLERNEIQTRPIFTGNILRQPAFRGLGGRNAAKKYVAADKIMNNSFLIGCHHGLTPAQLLYLKGTFKRFFDEHLWH